MKTLCITMCSFVLFGCSHSRPAASLTEMQAKMLALQLANEEASKRYHCQPFQDGQPVHFEAGHWTWNAVEGIGTSDVEAKVELAPDGSTNRVDMQLLDSKNGLLLPTRRF